MILVLHRVVTGTAANSNEISTIDLEDICNYLKTKGIPVRNVDDVAQAISIPRRKVAVTTAATGPVYSRKAANTVRNNRDVLAVDDLTVPVVAGGIYEVDAHLIYSTDAAADLKLGWSYPASSTMEWVADGLITSSTPTAGQVTGSRIAINGTAAMGGVDGGLGARIITNPKGYFVAGADGNLSLTWAQNVINATDSTLYAGSFLKPTRVAYQDGPHMIV